MVNITACRLLSAVMLGVLSSASVALAQQSDQPTAQSEKANDSVANNTSATRQSIPEYVDPSLIRRSIIIVDDAQREASERFSNFMGQVDGFISNSDDDTGTVRNDSWLRLRIDGIRARREGFELDPSLKLRAVLPQTERKLKLLVSTGEEDNRESGSVQGTVGPQQNQNASFALRFVRSARENGDVDLDIGIRQQDGNLQYFGRLNTRIRLDFGDNWQAKATNSYRHYNKSGFENSLSFDFRRLLYDKDHLYFRTSTNFYWEKGQKGAVIGHTTGLYWRVDKNRSFALEGLAGYHTALNSGVEDRFRGHEFRIRWRHNIWRPWFFYEVWPSIAWPATIGYRRANGIFLRAEVFIGQPR